MVAISGIEMDKSFLQLNGHRSHVQSFRSFTLSTTGAYLKDIFVTITIILTVTKSVPRSKQSLPMLLARMPLARLILIYGVAMS